MDKSIYVAMTGASQALNATAIHANNLANVSTTGFRSDFAQARAMSVISNQLPTRTFAMTERPGTNQTSGTLMETGRDLDVAIEGEGWLAVMAPDGTEAYTRAGELQLDTYGQLLTGNGLPVMGNGGPIALPPAENITIGADGTITVRELGAGSDTLAQIDRIKLIKPESAALYKGEDGLMHSRDNQPIVADATVSLASGFLESSNVNAVSELTEIISLSRQSEMQMKIMQGAKENSEASARILQLS